MRVEFKRASSFFLALFSGSLLYAALNWIPIVGPLACGFVVGFIRRGGPKDGFNTGMYSGVLGFILIVFLFGKIGLLKSLNVGVFPSILIAWIFLIWNAVSIFFVSVGGALSSMFFHAQDFFERRLSFPHGKGIHDEKSSKAFFVCPACGSGVEEGLSACHSCGKNLT